ncbi:uncharacterized [Tachysurus ichikawai]
MQYFQATVYAGSKNNLATLVPRPSAPNWAWLSVAPPRLVHSVRSLRSSTEPPSAQTAASVTVPNGIPLPSCEPEQPGRH